MRSEHLQHGRFSWKWHSILLAVFLLASPGFLEPPSTLAQQASLPKLTLAEIEGLVSHGVPDSTMSTQVERRGISFAPTQAILDSLRAKGAGPLTLAAIARERGSAPPAAERSSSPNSGRRHPKLTEADLQHLIRIQASDAFVAEQVQARGVDFSATNAQVSSLGGMGAGPRTLSALSSLVVTGTVQLHTEPDASVSLDGKLSGRANSLGLLLLQDVMPGRHTVSIGKDGFHPAQQGFSLGDRQTIQVSAPMQWAGALLTISAQPANASISIKGPASFSGPLNSARCPPGSYTATVTLSGYASQTRNFTLTADQIHEENFQLAVDRTTLSNSLEDAETHLISGDVDDAIVLTRHILTMDPSDAEARSVLAEASFLKGNLESFVSDATPAIRAGQSVTIPMMQVHIFPRRSFEQVQITISSSGLGFHCISNTKCKMPKSLTYDLVDQSSVTNDPTNSFTMLHFGWSEHPHAFVIHDLDFVPLGSGMVSAQPQPGTVAFVAPKVAQIPANSIAQYRAILAVIGHAHK